MVIECGLLKISVNETDTTTSGLRWIFHMHSEFSRPAMCNNAIFATGTCFIQKIYAPSSSLLQGKHLP
jgi:hypothetical protein